MRTLDVVIPAYNEPPDVVKKTVEDVRAACASVPGLETRIVVVDDGSEPALAVTGAELRRHETNRGYGAALKTGIRGGRSDWIAIVDADSTYPVADLPRLLAEMGPHDMAVGVRTGPTNETPVLRRLPKRVLNRFASYLACRRIADLNSGMRVFTRELADYLWELFPRGFSFTSTLTLGAIVGGYEVREVPISYFKRAGTSSIHPVKDTLRFFGYSLRLGLLFSPMRVFSPIAALLFAVGFIKGFLRDYFVVGHVGNASVMLMLAAVQIVMMGLLGELIVHNRKLRSRER
jgi:glycosyltransferase involved in cell wall biosynthesis